PGAPGPEGCGPVVVLDVPLLVQSGWIDLCDRVIVVACDEAVRHERLAKRRWSPQERASRESAWHRRYDAQRIPQDKIVPVDASRDLPYTLAQVDAFWAAVHDGRRPA
ncbi:MAG: dephospho-CoA kinase, partial [Planctomycetia bacterium]|nr:dephospho-CoA kinase [Planctomycetia bacterium]